MAKRKAPAFQIYPDDWLSDTQLMQASDANQGRWMRILCRMWRNPQKGRLDGPGASLCKALGLFPDEFLEFIEEVIQFGFADLQINGEWIILEGEFQDQSVTEALLGNAKSNAEITLKNAQITLINRRMWKEQKSNNANAERQRRYKAKQRGNTEVTPSSPSPTPYIPSKKDNTRFLNTPSYDKANQGGECDEGTPPSQFGPKKTPYPSKGRPSRQVFMACLKIFQINKAQVNEDSAWRAWCDMEERNMLAEDIPIIRDRLVGLFTNDHRWSSGFAPSFTNCIRNRAWRDEPVQKSQGPRSGGPIPRGQAVRNHNDQVFSELAQE